LKYCGQELNANSVIKREHCKSHYCKNFISTTS